MRVERLFQVLVVTGASSTAGLTGCGSDNNPGPYGGGASGTAAGGASGTAASGASGTATGGASGTATGGASGTATGGASGTATGGASGSTASCDTVCSPDPNTPPGSTWTDCNGCCCWLPAGTTAHAGPTAICGEEPCCSGRGR